MNHKSKINLIKTIVFFSLVVVFSGVAFDLENSRKLINPEMDTYEVSTNKDDGTISITTIDSKDKEHKTKSNSNNRNNINTQGNTNNRIVANNNYRNSIEKKYGISIKYGNEINGYTVAELKTIPLTNELQISNYLSMLDGNLAYYPKGFFKEIKNSGFNVSIYLIKKFSADDVTGITNSTNKNVVISIATEYQFKESIHHELYHYIEKYMYSKGVKYPTWDSLNPAKFKYGNPNSTLSFSYTASDNAPFVNNYAQVSAEEDRASTFEYMTADNKSGCLNNGKPIWLKAKYICEQIDTVFSSVTPSKTEYWERFVY
ncbi:MAG: hypothetical protein IKG58_01425 [Bacilli bacterium]|nr:hypothetical protein [Bacilli bacterium]MBR3049205.1 hypothetical protein [Bacilli bacterium]